MVAGALKAESQEDLDLARRLHAAGDYAAAGRIYRRLVTEDPGRADAWYLLGRVCYSTGHVVEAIACYRAALALRPAFVEALNNLGISLNGLGQHDEAIACYREAIRLRPRYVEAHSNLGNVLDRVGRGTEAVDCLRHAIRLKPDFVEAHNNLGIILKGLRAWNDAVASLREAVRLKPDFAEAHCNLGIALGELGKDEDAKACYEQALSLKPSLVPALCGRGQLAVSRGHLEDAEAIYRESLQIRPDSAELWASFGFVLAEEGLIAEGLDAYRKAINLEPGSSSPWGNYLYHLNYDPEVDLSTLLGEHRRWAELINKPASAPTARSDGGPLRVGYVSPDLRHHAVASFLEPILANHDRKRVEIYCYSDVVTPDAVTARLRGYAHAWRDIRPLNDRAVEALIVRDQIDILVDLAGHTARNRLAVFAGKPAPVQISYLGYPEATGLSTIDALISDDVIDPIERSSEGVLRIPGSFCCFAPPTGAADVAPSPMKKNGFPTFGSLHKLPKLNPQVINLWSSLLLSVPGSRLLLIRDSLKGRRGQELLNAFETNGVEAGRVEIRHDWNSGNHFDYYSSIDLTLDTFPWSGHTTACESLWMGVPVVTLAGDRRASRLTASVLNVMGLTDLIAETPEQYVATARLWVEDSSRLARLRSELRDLMRACRLCDGPSFTRDLESAYEGLWERRRVGV